MKPIFTIHEGEFLVGDYITRKLGKRYDVWVPTRDSGVDLLVTRRKGKGRPVGLQVKFSRSYRIPKGVVATSWFKLEPAKVRASRADLWVFVIITLKHKQYFVVIPTRELARRIPKDCGSKWHVYLWVYPGKRCYNVRDIPARDRPAVRHNGVSLRALNFTAWLGAWESLKRA